MLRVANGSDETWQIVHIFYSKLHRFNKICEKEKESLLTKVTSLQQQLELLTQEKEERKRTREEEVKRIEYFILST